MDIFTLNFKTPMEEAAIQARYSRSLTSARELQKQMNEDSTGKFIREWYSKARHKSIGDGAHFTLFNEGVSILAAKAIESHQLYSGQETSTRYIDFSTTEWVNPFKDCDEDDILQFTLREVIDSLYKMSIETYNKVHSETLKALKEATPRPNDVDESTYENALSAQAFDLARGYLMPGMTTNVAWHTSFSNFNKEIIRLMNHPLQEVKDIAAKMLKVTSDKYPDFVSPDQSLAEKKGVSKAESIDVSPDRYYLSYDYMSNVLGYSSKSDIVVRPPSIPRDAITEINEAANHFGSVTSMFEIDFGSYRDLDRHRTGYNSVTLLELRNRPTSGTNFNKWYLTNLPDDDETMRVADNFLRNVKAVYRFVREHTNDPVVAQYCLPMLTNVRMVMTQPLTGFVYMVRMRSSKYVHPTARDIVFKLHDKFVDKTGLEFDIFPPTPIGLDFKRGNDTLGEKT